MDHMEKESLDITKLNIEKLKKLFPSIVTDGKVDFEMLKVILGEEIDTSNEKYSFTWNGKANSIKFSQTPSTGTLIPCKDESVNWNETNNLYIEGDNAEVLKLLQKTYYGKIKMIYIDPPYNTGHDFVYKDSFKNTISEYKKITSQESTSNPETNGRFHTDWLNMMYPRISLSKSLLTNDGVLLISMSDTELKNLLSICEEIFQKRILKFLFGRKKALLEIPRRL